MINEVGQEIGENFATYPRAIGIMLAIAWVVVRIVKDPRTPGYVPPQYRPWLAAGVGMLEGVLHATLIAKTSALDGLLNGFLAGGGAVLLQSYFIEPIKAKPGTAMLAFCAFVSCTPGQPSAPEIVGGITAAIYPVDERLRAEYSEDIAACPSAQTNRDANARCEAAVDADWKPAREGMLKIREFWCAAKPEDCRQ